MDRHERTALDRYITGNFGEDSTAEECPKCGLPIDGETACECDEDDDDSPAAIVCTADSLAALAAEVRRDKTRKSLADFLGAHAAAWREEVRLLTVQRDHALGEVSILLLKLGE